MKTLALGLLLIPTMSSAQVTYDLLLKGGHVIDPKNHVNAMRDGAIARGRIAAVTAQIPASKAYKTVNVAGFYVTPDLVRPGGLHHRYSGREAA